MRDIPAEKDTVAATAAALRHEAIQDRYRHPHRTPDPAFGMASVLDMLGLKWTDLDDETRAGVLEVCETISRPARPGTSPRSRPPGTPG